MATPEPRDSPAAPTRQQPSTWALGGRRSIQLSLILLIAGTCALGGALWYRLDAYDAQKASARAVVKQRSKSPKLRRDRDAAAEKLQDAKSELSETESDIETVQASGDAASTRKLQRQIAALQRKSQRLGRQISALRARKQSLQRELRSI